MQLTKDTPVCTRDGREVKILADDAPGDCPLVGYIKLSDGTIVAGKWSPQGVFEKPKAWASSEDLAPVHPELWINVYGPNSAEAFYKKHHANEASDAPTRVALHRITLSEETIYRGG